MGETNDSLYASSSKSLLASSKSFRDDEELLIDLASEPDAMILTSFRGDRIAHYQLPLINGEFVQWLDA